MSGSRRRSRSAACRTSASVQIFENRGEMMGASNPHPHGQIWATRHPPNELEKETHRQGDYLLQHGRPLLLDYLEQELQHGERIVVRQR